MRSVLIAISALFCGWGVAFATQPNIVVIVSDDAAYSNFGFTSALNDRSTQFETPNLDALAQQSVVMRQGYVAASLCGPSRAGLLTGQYQQRFGYEENLGVFSQSGPTWGLTEEQVTIAQQLKSLGYTTGAIGKWHSGYYEGLNRPLDKGFDEFYGILGGGRSYWTETSPSLDKRIMKGNEDYELQYRVEGDPDKYDPVQGRYVTDAWGEEAVDFINRHASDENPFFLYLSYTAPHTPDHAKSADLDHFSGISDSLVRTQAAMTYALDRSIGEVYEALEANGVDDNTMVVFMNDNGAPSTFFNPPYRGNKGTTFEGGYRVPFFIKAPGLAPGVYDGPVSAYDILPTLAAAAGGDVSQIATDGYDVMPLLAGEETDDPHEVMIWRAFDAWSVLKDGWKLTSPVRNNASVFLYDVATDPFETTNLYSQNPDIVADLTHEFTYWEATMAKPKWGPLSTNNQNQFDHFVFRTDQATTVNWDAADAWQQAGTATNATLKGTDAYANAVIEFTVRNDSDYTAVNNMKRESRLTFMLNQLHLTGDFGGTIGHQGTITGNALLFVKNLFGVLPQIRLDAASSGSSANFTFDLGVELQLLHDLEITGEGTQPFVISGNIRDYHEPRSIIKSGTSSVTLAGDNTFGGALVINGGQIRLNSSGASIRGAEAVFVATSATLTLEEGTIAVDTLINPAASGFEFFGGRLMVTNVAGSIENHGGTFAPGESLGVTTVTGSFWQSSGVLEIEIGDTIAGTQFDRLAIDGTALLAGTLEVQLIDGYIPALGETFEFLVAASGVTGAFADMVLPILENGMWNASYSATAVSLLVTVNGDYNGNGVVDAADYTVWRDMLGQSVATGTGADGDFDGQITSADYSVWKSRFGESIFDVGSSSNGLAAVPEPGVLTLLIVGALCVGHRRRRNSWPPVPFSLRWSASPT